MDLLKPLSESGLHVIIRPHPQSAISEQDILEKIRKELKNCPNVEWDFERENLISMMRSDVMISDFSGIMSDYWFLLGKPVIYTKFEFDKRGYDLSDSENEPWKFKMLKTMGIELVKNDFQDIEKLVFKCINDKILEDKIKEAKETAYFYPGHSGEKAADALLKIHAKL